MYRELFIMSFFHPEEGGYSMIVTFQSAIPKEDYTLEITMTNNNRLVVDMKPYLDTVQFCPLKVSEVWRNIEVRDTSLRWRGRSKVELSVDTLLALFRAGAEIGQDSNVQEAAAKKDWQLSLQLDNGNRLDMDVGQLLEYSMFAPLLNRGLWKTMRRQQHSLLWEDKSIRLELPVKSILDYFA